MEEAKRRTFLKHILAGSAVVVGNVAAVQPVGAKVVRESRKSDEVLYHESPDFARYYKTLRS
jgi:hypothetical protein